jgi:hypothetical protein
MPSKNILLITPQKISPPPLLSGILPKKNAVPSSVFIFRKEIIVTWCQIWAVGWIFYVYVDYFRKVASFVNSAIVMK